jgi:hypothetical protein
MRIVLAQNRTCFKELDAVLDLIAAFDDSRREPNRSDVRKVRTIGIEFLSDNQG